MKITKGMTLRILLISYRFTDKVVKEGNLGNIIKNYYENNSRNTITINLTSVSYAVPFTNKEIAQAVQYVKNIMPKNFDINVHFCNPKTSHTGNGNVITYASVTNTVHEFGHALGLSHANLNLNGTSMGSRDPFDQMTMFSPYPSTNAVHRYQLDWFLTNELVEYVKGKTDYTIGMLKNFADKTSAKVLLYKIQTVDNTRKYFISYGGKKIKKNDTALTNYVTLHTIRGENSSFLIGMYKVDTGKMFTNLESGLSITIGNEHSGMIDLIIVASMTSIESKSDTKCESCEDCELKYIADNTYDLEN